MGLLQSLFGGSKSKSASGNHAWPQVQQLLSPAVQTGANAFNRLNDELAGGFEGYKTNAGFNDVLTSGIKGLQGVNAAKGMLYSGATGKGIADYATKLTGQYYNNYLDRLSGISQTGMQAISPIISAGQWSTGKSSSSNGILTSLFG